MPGSVVLMSREEVQAATARRKEIVFQLLEFMTSSAFSTRELEHFRAVGSIFNIQPVIAGLCGQASTLEGRCELALSACLAALSISIDETPPVPPQRVLDRREARAADRAATKDFAAAVAEGKRAVDMGKLQGA
jgi:hypothetical protein